MPPDNIVLAQSGAEIPPSSLTENGYELLFDSFIRCVRKGVRGSVVSARQLLFRIGPVFVDVEIGCEGNSDRASLIGQMLDSSNPGRPPAGIPIALLDRGRNIANTLSNDNGEFQFEFSLKGDLKLSVTMDCGIQAHLPISFSQAKTRFVPSAAKRTATRTITSAAGAL